MNFKTKKLCFILLLFFIGLSFHTIRSHRSLQQDMGRRYIHMYNNIQTSIDIIETDIKLFEENPKETSKLLPLIGQLNELQFMAHHTPPINSLYPLLLREIQVNLIQIARGEVEGEQLVNSLEYIHTTFEVIGLISEVVADKIAEDNPLSYFREIESHNSPTRKRISQVFNDFGYGANSM